MDAPAHEATVSVGFPNPRPRAWPYVLLTAPLLAAGCEFPSATFGPPGGLSLQIVVDEPARQTSLGGMVRIDGPVDRNIAISPGETKVIEVSAGAYDVGLESLVQGPGGAEVDRYAERTGVVVNQGSVTRVSLSLSAFAPGTPSAPASAATGEPITVSWPALPGADGYRLEYSTDFDAGFSFSDWLPTTSLEVSDVPEGSQTFRVRARNRFGSEGVAGTVSGGTQIVTEYVLPNESCSDFSPWSVVTFEDANLESAVRAASGVGPSDHLTCERLSVLDNVDASGAGIASLAGLQNAPALINLALHQNAISDLSHLGQLTGLGVLVLGENPIDDVGPLSGLTSLRFLSLERTDVSDLGPLNGLVNLTELHLFRAPVTDIGPLSGLTALDRLFAGEISVSDLAPLSGLTTLTELHLANNPIADLGPLSGLTNLEILAVNHSGVGAQVTDVGPLSGLTSLTELHIGAHAITAIDALSGLVDLRVIDLGGNQVSDLSPLTGLTDLDFLQLAGNLVTDVGPLAGLTNLTLLDLEENIGLANIQGLLTNTGLGPGDTVDLKGTGVNCADVAVLQAKGAFVQSDCP